MNAFKKRVVTGALLLGAPLASQAATVTNTFQVLLNLQASCTVTNPQNLDFGNATEAQVVAGSVAEATGSFDVTCSNGTSYDIGLNNGLNSANAPAGNRAMTSASGNGTYVGYSLYQTSGTSTPWGDIGSGTERTSLTGTGSAQSYTVYGSVPAQTPTIAATDTITGAGVQLSDTVTVTVSF
ncbi:MAG: spore coat U domain-containing protein [Alcanivorax sp.]|nr:spore coat U domain-containing protein [Alcanivorax sp.]